ncbi:MAG: TrkH family potassium uptake protein [Ruminococcaceae bacterium]|nr:TrkH family potassium uptake protein [Oscillospiraceae bacterium]
MNGSMILFILGYVLRIEGLLMLPSAAVGLIYRETQGWAYLAVGILCVLLGTRFSRERPENSVFYLKDGCVATALSWIVMSAFGALPFMLTGEIPSFTDAMFETVSGFTTTGASILTDVEAMCHCSLFWRSFTHWIGGMGVLVFLLAVVPLSGGSHFNLMRAESPGPSVGKLVPKVKATARLLYLIYMAMTLIQIVLLAFDMPLFDAIVHSFGTAGTGGFGVKADSFVSYSPYSQWIVTIFMILFGVNFNAYYFLLFRKFRKAWEMEEVRWYFAIILAAITILFLDVVRIYGTAFEALTHAAFQVASIITTTGFATADFNLWGQTSKVTLVLLMFVGACAGSTGGGIKVSRIVLQVKTMIREMYSYIHPKGIRSVKMDGKPVDNGMIHSVCVYMITFLLLFCGSVFIVSLEGRDLVTTFTAVAATINNIGPGLELVGPAGNFAMLSGLSKWTLIFDMLAGRLELFPLLILFHPSLWRDSFSRRAH